MSPKHTSQCYQTPIPTTPSSTTHIPPTQNYLILGDGDFSYSLDVCRFLHTLTLFTDDRSHSDYSSGKAITPSSLSSLSSSSWPHPKNAPSFGDKHHYRIVCTGIDPYEEVTHKYHDAGYILSCIRSVGGCSSDLADGTDSGRGGKKRPWVDCSTCIDDDDDNDDENDDDGNDGNDGNDENDENARVRISIHHGVNAILPWSTPSPSPTPTPPLPNLRYHRVIFNHPHLGIENAQRHAQFLSHFFYSCVHHWLMLADDDDDGEAGGGGGGGGGGVLYLTLVKGQAKRWECIERASESGLELLERREFLDGGDDDYDGGGGLPSIASVARAFRKVDGGGEGGGGGSGRLEKGKEEKEYGRNRYRLRRHQSGKSFAGRRGGGGSETLVFGRPGKGGGGDGLAWDFFYEEEQRQRKKEKEKQKKEKEKRNLLNDANRLGSDVVGDDDDDDDKRSFQCPHCEKSFGDERARKNHILCVHPHHHNPKPNRKCKRKASLPFASPPPSSSQNEPKTQPPPPPPPSSLPSSPLLCPFCTIPAPPPSNNNNNTNDNGHVDNTNKNQKSQRRTFANERALQDHIRAKHGRFTDIKPDWAAASVSAAGGGGGGKGGETDRMKLTTSTEVGVEVRKAIGKCDICKIPFFGTEAMESHFNDFVPSFDRLAADDKNNDNDNNNNNGTKGKTKTFLCPNCGKGFKDLRAQRQHFNFCSSSSGSSGTDPPPSQRQPPQESESVGNQQRLAICVPAAAAAAAAETIGC